MEIRAFMRNIHVQDKYLEPSVLVCTSIEVQIVQLHHRATKSKGKRIIVLHQCALGHI